MADDPSAPPSDATTPTWSWGLRIIGLVVIAATFFLLRPGGGGVTRLPEFSLPALVGDETWTDRDLQGRPAVINFWASWCEPCRNEAPMLDDFHRRLGDQVLILGVDVQDVPLAARQFAEEYDLTYPLIQDLDQVLYKALRETDGLPQTYFVTAAGEVITSGPAAPALGELEEAQLQTAIDALLAESSEK